MVGELRTICIRLHSECDLKCAHCWAMHSRGKNEYLDVSLLLQALNEMKDNIGLKHVSLSGGEPLLFPALNSLIMELARMKFELSLTTNGNDVSRLRQLLHQLPEEVFHSMRIRISLDGGSVQHERLRGRDTYARAIESVRTVSTVCGKASINTVVSPQTVVGFEELLNDVSGLSIDHWALITEVPAYKRTETGFSIHDILKTANDLKKVCLGCSPAKCVEVWNYLETKHNYVLIESDGRIIAPGYNNEEARMLTRISELDLNKIKLFLKAFIEKGIENYFRWTPNT